MDWRLWNQQEVTSLWLQSFLFECCCFFNLMSCFLFPISACGGGRWERNTPAGLWPPTVSFAQAEPCAACGVWRSLRCRKPGHHFHKSVAATWHTGKRSLVWIMHECPEVPIAYIFVTDIPVDFLLLSFFSLCVFQEKHGTWYWQEKHLRATSTRTGGFLLPQNPPIWVRWVWVRLHFSFPEECMWHISCLRRAKPKRLPYWWKIRK